MILIIALVAIMIWGIVATILDVRQDGYRATPTDWSRVAGRDALQDADPGHTYR